MLNQRPSFSFKGIGQRPARSETRSFTMWMRHVSKKQMLAQQCRAIASTSKTCQAMLCNRSGASTLNGVAVCSSTKQHYLWVFTLFLLWGDYERHYGTVEQFWHTCSSQCPVPTMLSHLQEQINHSQSRRIEHRWRPEKWLPQCSMANSNTSQALLVEMHIIYSDI